jgi:hypothetical protein
MRHGTSRFTEAFFQAGPSRITIFCGFSILGTRFMMSQRVETVRNFVPWRILLRHWEAFFEHDGELAFDGVPFAD